MARPRRAVLWRVWLTLLVVSAVVGVGYVGQSVGGTYQTKKLRKPFRRLPLAQHAFGSEAQQPFRIHSPKVPHQNKRLHSKDVHPASHMDHKNAIHAVDENIHCSEWLTCESTCTHNSDRPIPKHVHMISLGHPFTYTEWLTVISARQWIQPDQITVYTDGKQDSCWWTRALPYIQHQLIYLLPGSSVLHGEAVSKLAHMADFLRLMILYHQGGIYIDTDVITVRSFDDLLNHQVVLGKQCKNLTNIAVMLAHKQNCFICKFAQNSCQHFSGRWIEHSVGTLTRLLRVTDKESEGIRVLSQMEGFFPGCWDSQGQRELFEADLQSMPAYNLSKIYTVHLYEAKSRRLMDRTMYNPHWIANNTSVVATVLRNVLPSDFSHEHFNTYKCLGITTAF